MSFIQDAFKIIKEQSNPFTAAEHLLNPVKSWKEIRVEYRNMHKKNDSNTGYDENGNPITETEHGLSTVKGSTVWWILGGVAAVTLTIILIKKYRKK